MFPLDDFLRCLHSLFYGTCSFFPAHILFWPTLWTSTSLSPKFFTKWLMWMASVTWFNTIRSKPFPTGFPSETIGLHIAKTIFPCNSVISLNYESLQTWTKEKLNTSIHMHIACRFAPVCPLQGPWWWQEIAFQHPPGVSTNPFDGDDHRRWVLKTNQRPSPLPPWSQAPTGHPAWMPPEREPACSGPSEPNVQAVVSLTARGRQGRQELPLEGVKVACCLVSWRQAMFWQPCPKNFPQNQNVILRSKENTPKKHRYPVPSLPINAFFQAPFRKPWRAQCRS